MRKFLLILIMMGFFVVGTTGCNDSTMTPTMDDPEAFTVAFVQEAIDLYKEEGREAIISHYNDPASINGQWYVFIIDENNIISAHAPRPDLVGTNLIDLKGLDGSMLGAEIAKATESGIWIEYLWNNPETGEDELKRTWAIRHNGYIFGSGYYEPVPTN